MAKRQRKNDGYAAKVEQWTDHLNLALKGEGRYSIERCEESLTYFKGKRAAYIAKHGETSEADVQSAKDRAIRKCKERFEGLNESERMLLANKVIKDAADIGISVNETMAFLKDAEVMNDTELIHSLTF